MLEDALRKQINERWIDHLILKNDEIKNRSFEDLSLSAEFIKACTGRDSKLDTYILAHWMWQVKRKMQSLPVYNHIMLVFTGKQGGGKSSAIDILTRTLKDYRTDMAITQLADERNYHSLEKTFVIVADEMQGCNKTDIEYLKHMITAHTVSARKLYTNSRDKIFQNASLIGSSNKPIDLLIRDETGMRRFFAIDCLDKLDWKALNGLNSTELWQSIDEQRPEGYICEVLPELRERQEDYRYRDSIEGYLEETKALGEERTRQISIREFFNDYVDWCEESQNKPVDKNYFSKRLRALGIVPWKTRNARGVFLSVHFMFWRDQVIETNAETQIREIEETLAK